MASSDRLFPLRMRRVAVVTPSRQVRPVLAALAQSGVLELTGPLGAGEGPALEALRRLDRDAGQLARPSPVLAVSAPDVEELERRRARAMLAGEVELERRRASAVRHSGFSLFVGWAPAFALPALSNTLAALDASLVELRAPRGQEPPTMLAPSRASSFRPLLDMYGAIPYEDVDPTLFTTITYCLMFGMMFGDLGYGALLLLAAILLRWIDLPRARSLQKASPIIAACGASTALFGVLYGELFGPTKVLPTLWLNPLDDPTGLLVAAIAIGGGLLLAGQVLGSVNRLREGGLRLALTASSGAPGMLILIAAALLAVSFELDVSPAQTAGLALGGVGALLLLLGLHNETRARGASAIEVLIGFFDALLRIVSNVFSFSRLAAFGLMHAALAKVVIDLGASLIGTPIGDLAAGVAVLLLGALAFALEGFVAAIQALRLEYYELFSRVLSREGKPFAPWRLPVHASGGAR